MVAANPRASPVIGTSCQNRRSPACSGSATRTTALFTRKRTSFSTHSNTSTGVPTGTAPRGVRWLFRHGSCATDHRSDTKSDKLFLVSVMFQPDAPYHNLRASYRATCATNENRGRAETRARFVIQQATIARFPVLPECAITFSSIAACQIYGPGSLQRAAAGKIPCGRRAGWL